MIQQIRVRAFFWAALIACCSLNSDEARGDERAVISTKYRLYGLFSPDREDDLRLVMRRFSEIKLISIDFAAGEATFEFDPQVAFKSSKPEQITEHFNNMVRGASNGTFGILPLCAIPRDKLQFIEIPVYGLDCKACSFACYKMLAETDGIEFATASFKDQHATVWLDPTKTSREALETILKQREVSLEPAKVIITP